MMRAPADPHAATWMAWPSASYTWGDTRTEAEQARKLGADMANQIVACWHVHVLLPATQTRAARRRHPDTYGLLVEFR